MIDMLIKAAEAGNTDAMNNLALAYLKGDGVQRNKEQFEIWIKKAAEAIDLKAIHISLFVNAIAGTNNKYYNDIIIHFVVLINKIMEIKESHLCDGIEFVYHFTTTDIIKEILPIDGGYKNHLRLYNSEYMNDPDEGQRLFQVMKSKYKNIYDFIKPQQKDECVKLSLEKKDIHFYICSFTKENDKLVLWRAYGNNGDGISIKIAAQSFDQIVNDTIYDTIYISKNKNEVNRTLYKIIYTDKEIKENIDKIIDPLTELIGIAKKLNDEVAAEAIRQSVIAALMEISFLYKNEEYSHDNEYRIIQSATIDRQIVELDEKTGKLYVECKDILFNGIENGIVIGPRVNEKRKVELEILYRLHKNNFKNVQVKLSDVRYR
jgi:hypothetical protein